MFKFSFAIVLAIPFSALAQTSELPAAASVSATPVAAPLVVGQQLNANLLRAGTEIRLRTLTELGSKTSRVSERFNLEVTEDVRLNGQIVIPVGTRGVGEVTKVTKKGMFGKSGKLETQLLFLRIGDQQIRISGSVGDRGKGGAAATVGGTLVFLPAGFFITGTSAVLPPGAAAVGFLESDLPVVFGSQAAVAPLVVPVPVAQVPVVAQPIPEVVK